MKQQISPWSIYDNFQPKNDKEIKQSKPKDSRPKQRILIKLLNPKKSISSSKKKPPQSKQSKQTYDLEVEKKKLTQKIDEYLLVQVLQDKLKQQSQILLPVLSQTLENPKPIVIVNRSEPLKLTERQMKNIPHFPKVRGSHRFFNAVNEANRDFDDSNIHQKLHQVQEERKKKSLPCLL